MSFPPLPVSLTADAVHAQLREIHADLRKTSTRVLADLVPVEDADVRLLVFRDGTWFVAHGDVSFDQHHADWCGASSVGRDDTDEDLLVTAWALLDEVEEMVSEDDDSDPERAA